MEQSDDYMIMHPKLEKNSIFIIHAHDGQPITDCIKKNLEMYTQPPIKVKACDVTVIQSLELRHQVTALLLTPEMMAHLEANSVSKQTTLQIPENTTCVCLVHSSMNTEDDDKVRMVLEKTIPNFAVCKKIKLLYLRTATIEIVTLLDGMSKENSFPAILQYRLEPDYIVTVSWFSFIKIILLLSCRESMFQSYLFYLIILMSVFFVSSPNCHLF